MFALIIYSYLTRQVLQDIGQFHLYMSHKKMDSVVEGSQGQSSGKSSH